MIEFKKVGVDIGMVGSSGAFMYIFNNPAEAIKMIHSLEKDNNCKYEIKSIEDVDKCGCGSWTPISVLKNMGECLRCDHVRGDV